MLDATITLSEAGKLVDSFVLRRVCGSKRVSAVRRLRAANGYSSIQDHEPVYYYYYYAL